MLFHYLKKSAFSFQNTSDWVLSLEKKGKIDYIALKVYIIGFIALKVKKMVVLIVYKHAFQTVFRATYSYTKFSLKRQINIFFKLVLVNS